MQGYLCAKNSEGYETFKNREPESFRVSKYYPENWEFVVYSIPMLRMIWRACNLDEAKTYRLDGVCYLEHNLVEFDLKQAEILNCDEIEKYGE